MSDRKKAWVDLESLRSGVSADGFSGFSSATLQAWSPDLEADLQNTKYRIQKTESGKQKTGNGKQVRLSKCNSAAAWSPDRSRSATWLLVIETQGLMGIRHIRQ